MTSKSVHSSSTQFMVINRLIMVSYQRAYQAA